VAVELAPDRGGDLVAHKAGQAINHQGKGAGAAGKGHGQGLGRMASGGVTAGW
jgi:hypothetical protein